MQHELKQARYNLNSFPPYRYEADCTCGFSTKMPNEEAAVSQFVSHLQGKGVNVDEYLKVDKEQVQAGDTTREVPQRNYTFPKFERFPAEQDQGQLTPEEAKKQGLVEDTTIPEHNEQKSSGEPTSDERQAPQNENITSIDNASSSVKANTEATDNAASDSANANPDNANNVSSDYTGSHSGLRKLG